MRGDVTGRLGAAALSVLLTVFSIADAQSVAWTNTAGGNWSSAGNWSPNAVPGSGTNAFFTNNAVASLSYVATNDVVSNTVAQISIFNVGSATNTLLNNAAGLGVTGRLILGTRSAFDLNGFDATVGGGLTVSNLGTLIVRGATLTVQTNGGDVTFRSGSVINITNNGTLKVGATGAGGMTNIGVITLNSGGSILAGLITNTATGVILNSDGNGLISGFLQNRGSLLANSATAVLSLTNGGNNLGTLNVRTNATLNIGGTSQATANSSSVTFTNLAGGTINLGSPGAGGTLNASTTTVGVINQGTLQVTTGSGGGSTAIVNAVVVNDVGGSIIGQTAGTSGIIILDSLTTNLGTVTMFRGPIVVRRGDVFNGGIIRVHDDSPLLFLSDGTTTNSLINGNNGTLTVLTGNGSGNLTRLAAASLLNNGTVILTNLALTAGTSLQLTGTLTNNGTVTILRTDGRVNNLYESFTAQGIVNSGSLVGVSRFGSLVTDGQTINYIASPVLNAVGGTIVSSNQGVFVFAGMTNNGTLLAQSNSVLAIGAAGSVTRGRIIAGTSSFRNDGTITLQDGVFGVDSLTNAAAAMLQGRGDIGRITLSNLVSASTLTTNFIRHFATKNIVNSGLINPNGTLNAGAITNLSGGSIIGFGAIQSLDTTNSYSVETLVTTTYNTGARILNNAGASILASGGTLVLSNGLVANGNSGVLGGTNGGRLQLGDGTLALTNNSGGTIRLTSGELASGDLRNNGSIQFGSGVNALTVAGALTIANGTMMSASNGANTVSGIVTNQGTIQIVNSTITFSNKLFSSGRYISDPSTNTYVDDVTILASGTLEGGVGDLFDFKQSLFINSTNTGQFNLISSTVSFTGGADHTNEITGLDLGAIYDGLTSTNFAYGRLALGPSDDVYFRDGDGIGGNTNALYVGVLDLGGLVANISLLHSTNLNIYYDGQNAENSYLGGLTYSLDGGGSLIPLGVLIVPEPSTMLLLMATAAIFLRRRA